jgi:predicted acyltransferase
MNHSSMNHRVRSLDVLRGATVALMILVNNPGSWYHLYPPLAHAGWHGCTPTDLVFPFFLFAVGNALSLVQPQWSAAPPAAFWRKWARRTLLIFGLGLLLNAAPFVRWDSVGDLVLRDFSQLRIMGVLQRIALCWAAAALIIRFASPQGALLATASLLLGYWGLCVALGDASDPYGLIGWFGTPIDTALLGTMHLYRGEGVAFDPEGLASTAPAIAQVLIGWWVGVRLQREGPNPHTVARLLLTALALGVLAYAWQLVMPLNKKIWTSSYVLWTSALAIGALAALVWRVDMGEPRDRIPRGSPPPKWQVFCEAFGKNALFIFVMSGLVPRVLSLLRWQDGVDANGVPRFITPLPWAYRTFFEGLGGDPRLGSLLFALANVAAYWALARWLDRRGTYIKV